MRKEGRLAVWRALAAGLMGTGLSYWADSVVWAALFDARDGGARTDVAFAGRETAGRASPSPGPERGAPPWRRTA